MIVTIIGQPLFTICTFYKLGYWYSGFVGIAIVKADTK